VEKVIGSFSVIFAPSGRKIASLSSALNLDYFSFPLCNYFLINFTVFLSVFSGFAVGQTLHGEPKAEPTFQTLAGGAALFPVPA
jgi:hypothetical protein